MCSDLRCWVELRGFEPLTPSMRRGPGAVAPRSQTSLAGVMACGDGGWTSPGVAACLPRLAPNLAPHELVSSPNVRAVNGCVRCSREHGRAVSPTRRGVMAMRPGALSTAHHVQIE
jgi:hypothetical protein